MGNAKCFQVQQPIQEELINIEILSPTVSLRRLPFRHLSYNLDLSRLHYQKFISVRIRCVVHETVN